MPSRRKDKTTLATIIANVPLRNRVLFTLGVLALFRLGAHVPIPGIPRDFLANNPLLSTNLLNMYDLFAGGALKTLSIFALGIGPYISASILMQLLTPLFPALKELRDEGHSGQRKLRQLTRWLTLGLAALEASSLSLMMAGGHGAGSFGQQPGMIAFVAVILAASAMLIMWLAENITEHGIGNGSSLLLCVGIAARLPVMVKQTWMSVQAGQAPTWGIPLMLLVFALLVAASVIIQEGIRKVTIIGGKRPRLSGPNRKSETQLYLAINPAGVMPIAFASQFILFLGVIFSAVISFAGRFNQLLLSNKIFGHTWSLLANNPTVQVIIQTGSAELHNFLAYNRCEYYLLFGLLIVCFTLFYSSILLPPNEIAESLRKSNCTVEGVRPGRQTRDFFAKTIHRLSFIGAAAVMFIAMLPIQAAQFAQLGTLLGFGSTSVVILTGVALDTKRQANSHVFNARSHKRHLLGREDELS
jgi:preprotein translocase subunit SecY